MSKPNPLELPVIEMITQDEGHHALVRAALARKVRDPDTFLSQNDVDSRVGYRNVTVEGKSVMLTSVVILSVKPKPVPTDTPQPAEAIRRKE